jgi:hypothetical protein
MRVWEICATLFLRRAHQYLPFNLLPCCQSSQILEEVLIPHVDPWIPFQGMFIPFSHRTLPMSPLSFPIVAIAIPKREREREKLFEPLN